MSVLEQCCILRIPEKPRGGHERGGSARSGWCPPEGVPGAPPPKLGAGENKGKLLGGAEDLHLLVQQETLSSRKHEQLRCRDRIQEELKRAASTIFNRGLLIVVGKVQRI